MKRRTILLLAILGIVICHAITGGKKLAVKAQSTWSNNAVAQYIDLHVADSVVTYTSPYHIQVPGTAVSMIVPEGFERTVDMKGFSNGDTCIDVVEDHINGVGAKKKELETYIGYVKQSGWGDESLLYRKDFTFNGYAAFIICLSDTTSTRTAIYMAFGDARFNVTMAGTMTENSAANRAEIVGAMLTAYYARA